MNKRELEYSNLLLTMSNEILDYIKKYGLKSFDNSKIVKEQTNEKDLFIEEQEQFINVDNNKVELISSQKDVNKSNNIIPYLIGGWILYKILK